MSSAFQRRVAVATGLLLTLGVSTACSSGKETAGQDPVGKVDGKISLTYLQKQGDQEYFVGEAAGARAKADELGIDLKIVNLGNDANKTVGEVQSAVAQKTNGVIIVVPDPAVGPQVVHTAEDGKVALLTSDDQICSTGPDPASCGKADLVPRVGFSGAQMGEEVGKRAASEFKKAGWKASDTRIISAWKQDVTVCGDRVNASKKAFDAAVPGVKTINVATDNTPTGAQDKIAATITANSKVKNWVVWGCNDENVMGGVTALQNAGTSPANIIGVGLGAYLACKEWQSDKPSGMKAALFINGKDVGALAVQTMYDKLKHGKDFPQEAFAATTLVDSHSWKSAGLTCS
ncbi:MULTISPECIES: substrate-binding domain-containing protein [unclassified Streptomyces]|uniref:substrate-binding domain-containing protein n=1 Tax=unclassified Streptomyces TaxID=2593676 RepID=UPI002258E3AA|nr:MULTISPECIES: substrate-binding domain-containing protein [unclassified Streptomyces]WSP59369.1 substrate-binding domain-containing protein [Streptomyces sp. NBC_01241]WSU20113.1 substrate-binding domain-containing protein [Streptomyces sp. NBC_01108]MCX4791130.1 substrate-binding domain-containing protein [Streptomyces sp. NBC_01221]MCX4793151.1 substrate-binding domain-containing protein [Streptomyces sp. NBC_01242]WSP61040.1 substrate-binding domain-containing protein [Streptomyces sp. N